MPIDTEKKKTESIKVGILEVQGAFLEHKNALLKAKEILQLKSPLEIYEVRQASHVSSSLDGMIIPGGESTTMSLFLKRNNMVEPMRQWIEDKNHVTWGTCAGMIILAKQNENQKKGGQPMVRVILIAYVWSIWFIFLICQLPSIFASQVSDAYLEMIVSESEAWHVKMTKSPVALWVVGS